MLQSVRDSLRANGSRMCAFRIRCIATRAENGWRHMVAVGLGFSTLPDHFKDAVFYEYGDVCLIESWITADKVDPFVQAVAAGSATLGSHAVDFSELRSNWNERRYPSLNDYCEAPARIYESYRPTNLGFPERPLLHLTNPCYPTLGHAIREWTGLRRFVPQTTSNQGTVILVLPEFRASIQEIFLLGNSARITLALPQDETALTLRSTWVIGGRTRHSSERVYGDHVTIDVPRDAEEAYLWLLNEQGELLDSYQEPGFMVREDRRLLRGHGPIADIETILKDARSGETDTVEFKPFVKLDHKKQKNCVKL